MQVCGDGFRTTLEQCDDGNTNEGDGCNLLCQTEPGYLCVSTTGVGAGIGGTSLCHVMCGDGLRIPTNYDGSASEGCDDNNTLAGDGCSADCQVNP